MESAENGVVAVATAAGRRFDLILMDLHMPDMNGVEAATPHPRGVRGPNAAADAGLQRRQPGRVDARRHRAFDGWISKPVPADLRATLERCLASAGAHAAAPPPLTAG
ncbi:MAG: hypothetical protein U0802_15610 [Candidatus Binatia bacterium]